MMGRLYNTLPLFSTDYSSAASAVRDCGGLAVIYCPDGCMGNYVRFDEPRWAELPGNVLQLELREMDVIFGEGVFMESFKKLDNLDGIGFIGIVKTPVSSLVGFDTDVLCRQVSDELGIPAVSIGTNGYGNYHDGMSKAMEAIYDLIPWGNEVCETALIGFSPLEYTAEEAERIAGSVGAKMVFPGGNLRSLSCIRNAKRNVLLSSCAVGLADKLESEHGIPYVPYISREEKDGNGNRDILIVGEQFRSNNLRNEIRHRGGDADVATFFTLCDRFAEDGDVKLDTENGLASLASGGYRCIIGDPLIKGLIPDDVQFIQDPQSAISSRLFWNERIPMDLIGSLADSAVRPS